MRERAGRGCDAGWRRDEGGGVGETEMGLDGWSDGRRGGELRARANAAQAAVRVRANAAQAAVQVHERARRRVEEG